MMKSLLIVLTLFTSAPAKAEETHPAPEPTATGTGVTTAPTWSEKMRRMAKVLEALLVDLSDEARFKDPANAKGIEKNGNELAALAHQISESSHKAPDQDISLALIGATFSERASEAAKAYSEGHRAYARTLFLSITQSCIDCHSRTDRGIRFDGADAEKTVERFDPFSKANYLAAIREFDRALVHYGEVVQKKEDPNADRTRYEAAFRAGMSIAIRVKNDPDAAVKLAVAVIENPTAPYYLRDLAKKWKTSILAWKTEKPFKAKEGDPLLREAERLVRVAKAIQKYPADRSGDVLYWRATAILHRYLGSRPKGAKAAKALFLTGVSYDTLDFYGFNETSEFFYEGCIHADPNTKLARDCYHRYEESVYFGYTGSGGTYLPPEVREKLERLESLSKPVEKPERTRLK